MYIPFWILGGICLLLAYIFSQAWLKSKKITDHGQATIATVTDITAVSSGVEPGRRGVGGKFFQPVFAWTVNGQTYTKEHNVNHDPPKYHVGQEITIYYNPTNPAEMTLKGSANAKKILTISFAAAGTILLFIGILIWMI